MYDALSPRLAQVCKSTRLAQVCKSTPLSGADMILYLPVWRRYVNLAQICGVARAWRICAACIIKLKEKVESLAASGTN